MKAIITTRRISLRPPVQADFDLIRLLDTEVEGLKYINGGREKTMEESVKSFNAMLEMYESHGIGFNIMETIDDGEFIGWGGFKFIENSEKIELGYRIKQKFWGKGYTTEAAKALMKYGKEVLGLDRIYGRVDPENIASVKILENTGMRYISSTNFKGRPVSMYAL